MTIANGAAERAVGSPLNLTAQQRAEAERRERNRLAQARARARRRHILANPSGDLEAFRQAQPAAAREREQTRVSNQHYRQSQRGEQGEAARARHRLLQRQRRAAAINEPEAEAARERHRLRHHVVDRPQTAGLIGTGEDGTVPERVILCAECFAKLREAALERRLENEMRELVGLDCAESNINTTVQVILNAVKQHGALLKKRMTRKRLLPAAISASAAPSGSSSSSR